MRNSHPLLRVVAVAAVSYWGLALNCPLWPGPVPPGGGQNHDNRTCSASGNNAWSTASLADSNIAPKCLYSVTAPNQTVSYHFFVVGPNSSFLTGSNFLFMNVYTVAHVLNTSGGASFVTNPNNSNQQRADVSGLMGGGIATAPVLPLDSADFQTNTVYGNAEGWITIPGRVDAAASSIVGPNPALLGRTNTFRASPTWDTTFYTYQWRENGHDVTGATGAKYSTSWNTPGTDTVAVYVARTSGKSDTVVFPVINSFTVTLTGPTQVRSPGGTCSWSASPNGGSGAITYNWTWNGVHVGSGVSITHEVPSPPNALALSLTDALGNHATASRSISLVSTGGTACIQ
jgi:hypothetical protein